MTSRVETHTTASRMLAQSSTDTNAVGHTSSSTSSRPGLLSMSMSSDDADRMAAASRALHQCLEQLPLPPASEAAVAGRSNNSTKTTKDALADNNNNNSRNGAAKANDTTTTDAAATSWRDLLQKPGGNLLVHHMVIEAAHQCQHSLVKSFLPRMKACGLTEAQAKAGLVLFHDLDKSSKLRVIFDVLARAETSATDVEGKRTADTDTTIHRHKENTRPEGTNGSDSTDANSADKQPPISSSKPSESTDSIRSEPPSLSRNGAQGLIRTILSAISCCIGDLNGQKAASSKDIKVITSTGGPQHLSADGGAPIAASITADEADVLGAPSFDSASISMATLKEEHAMTETSEMAATKSSTSGTIRGDIADASFKAAKALAEFAVKTSVSDTDAATVMITFDTFGNWYNAGGCSLVPWLELLHLSKWKASKPHIEAGFKSSVSSSSASTVTTSTAGTAIISNTQSHAKHAPPVATLQVSSLNLKKPPPSANKMTGSRSSQKSNLPSLSSMLKEDEALMRSRTAPFPPPPHYHHHHLQPQQPPSPPSRSVVSFDFAPATSSPTPGASQMCINISEENLWVLRGLVYRTGLIYQSAADVCKTILRMSHKRMHNGFPLVTLRREDFRPVIRKLLLSGSSNPIQNNTPLSSKEMDNFGMILEDFFACFEGNSLGDDRPAPPSPYYYHQQYQYAFQPLQPDEVNAKELAVGFCFLCAGNKSTKLATGFELLDDVRSGYLSKRQLMRYLRSYLTMLVGMSQMKEDHARRRRPLSPERLREMRAAVENGAHWTLGHFLKHKQDIASKRGSSVYPRTKDMYSFESFANWYSTGGYQVAPWLELLELKKLVSLIGEAERFTTVPQGPHVVPPTAQAATTARECRSSHRRKSHNRASAPQPQVLFTFPLANHRQLVVLRDDAIYVRSVVDQLGLLSFTPENIWSTLTSEVRNRPDLLSRDASGKSRNNKKVDSDKTVLLDKVTFLELMDIALQSAASSGRKRSSSGDTKLPSSVQELLSNFFHSFDLKQSNLVALNELMGGLTLLCGGKKSTKLAFAFGVFDTRFQSKGKKGKSKPASLKSQALNAQELYLFLRSFLIVMFSCCCQTLDMSDSSVDRYIADTANMVADDVMQYQKNTRQKDSVDFDEFGEWYNEGGFEVAPWLELLDMKKWVLVDNFDALDTHPAPQPPTASLLSPRPDHDSGCPPPPPEDVLDPSFFEDNDNDIMHMDSIDEMDIILMQPSHDREGDLMPVSKFSYSPSHDRQAYPTTTEHEDRKQDAIKFNLVADDNNGGYSLSFSQKRILHLRQILMETGLHKISPDDAYRTISGGAGRNKADFDTAIRELLESKRAGIPETSMDILCDMFSTVLSTFASGDGKLSAAEFASGITTLCRGKKSDKLEFAFSSCTSSDGEKNGKMPRTALGNYLRSFLAVLVGISCSSLLDSDDDDKITTLGGEACDRSSTAAMKRAVTSGAEWAVAQIFDSTHVEGEEGISFDEFASWYTQKGYIVIPWLELLSLGKWITQE